MNKYSVHNIQVLMQVLYLIILWSVNDTNLQSWTKVLGQIDICGAFSHPPNKFIYTCSASVLKTPKISTITQVSQGILSTIVDEEKLKSIIASKLHCSWHIVTSARHVSMNQSDFSLLAISRPIYCRVKSSFLMQLHFQGIVGKGHASKPKAR